MKIYMDKRAVIFLFGIGLVCLIWIIYLFSVQIFDPHNLNRIVELRQNPAKKVLIPLRGNIFDRNYNLLVSSENYYQIDLDKSEILRYAEKCDSLTLKQVYKKIADEISKNSELSRKKVLSRLNNEDLYPGVYISENVSEASMIKIKDGFEKKKLPGLISTFSRMKRTYPRNNLAASLLGMIKENKDDGQYPGEYLYDTYGVCGIEASCDDQLSGEFGWQETVYDANNKRVPLMFLKEKSAVNGNSIILTIDSELQEILEKNLSRGVKEYKANKGLGVIMDPRTGEILAISGIKHDYENMNSTALRATTNLPVSFMFEPGSTLKPLTALIALEQDIYNPEDIIDCRDYKLEYKNSTRIISDAHEFSKLSFRDIIAYSSNVGISKIVEEVGSRSLYERMVEFGFGHKTGTDLSGEATGILRQLKDWQGFSLHSISFGQEIAVTTLQLANAYCTLANGGNVMQPRIIRSVVDQRGKKRKNFEPKILRKISNKKSLDTLKVFLESVIEYGTGEGTKIEDLKIAGKTGTAEKIISGESTYSKDKYTSIFAGFFPSQTPEYVIVIVFDEPAYEYHFSSSSAVPVFKQILTEIINRPDCNLMIKAKKSDTVYGKMPDLFGKTKERAKNILKRKNISYKLIEKDPDGIVVNQFPQPGVSYDKKEKVIIIIDQEKSILAETGNTDLKMPDLKGLTVRKALQKAILNNIRLQVKGHGIIYSQSIFPGKKTKYGEKCLLKAR